MIRSFIIFLFISQSIFVVAQQQKSTLIPDAIGLSFGFGNENTFLFDDPDYSYKTQYLKASFQYNLNSNKYQLGLAIQPQVHFLEHQLLNIFFVKPTDENFEENRVIYSQLKSMRLYALTIELNLSRKIFKNTRILAFLAIGPASIDTDTERLAKGFTFVENMGIGIEYELVNDLLFALKPSFSHVSNANLQLPNGGYNVMNLEFSLSWKL